MQKVLQIAIGAAAVLFLLTGIAWLLAPGMAGARLGMTLLDDVGRSTQIGDLASFFLTLGSCMLIGLATGIRIWFYPPMMLLGFAVVGRTLAWSIHGAAFATDMIAAELVVTALLYGASTKLRDNPPATLDGTTTRP